MADAALIGAWGTAGAAVLGGVVGIGVAVWSRGREDEKARIEREVEAALGRMMVTIQTVQQSATESAAKLSLDVQQGRTQLQEALDQGATLAIDLNASIQAVTALQGDLAAIEKLQNTPTNLILQARANPLEATNRLTRLLESKEAMSSDLEAGGDIARETLRNLHLARALYEKAVEEDSSNVSAKAEVLHVRASYPGERQSAKAEMLELAKQNPNHRNVIARALDLFVELRDYDGMQRFCEEMLKVSNLRSNLMRNLAIARNHLVESPDKIRQPFEEAVKIAEDNGEAGDLVNAVRPYARWLLKIGDASSAVAAVDRALPLNPREPDLHLIRGDALRRQKKYKEAKESYERMSKWGNAFETAAALDKLRDIEALEELGI